MTVAISLKNITQVFDKGTPRAHTAIKDISLDIHEGEFFIFVGRSGSGKSTLLRIMSNLEHGNSGEVTFGEGLSPRDIGFVFQQFALLPWLTVFQNVEMGLLSKQMSPHQRHARVMAELKLFHLESSAHLFPRELSGGMRQRVGIARALAIDPKIMFLDEPFSEVDSFIARELRTELLRIWEERKMTIVMVSHNIEETLELSDRIGVLSSDPGELKAVVANTLARPRELRSHALFELEDKLYKLIQP